jgi:hypothetical protein
VDVVVHRFRHRDHLHALAIKFRCIAQGVVTANRNQAIETQHLNVLQHRRRHIEDGAGDAIPDRFFAFELLPL